MGWNFAEAWFTTRHMFFNFKQEAFLWALMKPQHNSSICNLDNSTVGSSFAEEEAGSFSTVKADLTLEPHSGIIESTTENLPGWELGTAANREGETLSLSSKAWMPPEEKREVCEEDMVGRHANDCLQTKFVGHSSNSCNQPVARYLGLRLLLPNMHCKSWSEEKWEWSKWTGLYKKSLLKRNYGQTSSFELYQERTKMMIIKQLQYEKALDW